MCSPPQVPDDKVDIPDMPVAVPVPAAQQEMYPVDDTITYPSSEEMEQIRAFHELQRARAIAAAADARVKHAQKYFANEIKK